MGKSKKKDMKSGKANTSDGKEMMLTASANSTVILSPMDSGEDEACICFDSSLTIESYIALLHLIYLTHPRNTFVKKKET